MLILVWSFRASDSVRSLRLLALFYTVASNLPMLIATIVIFRTRLRNSIPSIRHYSSAHAGKVMKLGGMFFWLQIVDMIIFNTNEYLITIFVGPEMVVDYQIYNRIFLLISTVFNMALTPIWSIVTQACANDDYLWIHKLKMKLDRLALYAIAGQMILVPAVPLIVKVWLGDRAIMIDYRYSIAFALLGIVNVVVGVNAKIANGMGQLRTAFIFLTFGSLVNIPISYYLVKLTNSWISMPIANTVSLLPYCIVQSIVLRRTLLSKIAEVKPSDGLLQA